MRYAFGFLKVSFQIFQDVFPFGHFVWAFETADARVSRWCFQDKLGLQRPAS